MYTMFLINILVSDKEYTWSIGYFVFVLYWEVLDCFGVRQRMYFEI